MDPAGVRRRPGVLHPRAQCATAGSRSTAAASPRRARSTTRMSTSPRSARWVEHFVGALRLTGRSRSTSSSPPTATIHAIECNPRTHSRDHHVPRRPAGWPTPISTTATRHHPAPGARPTYWIYHELWRLLTQSDRRRRDRAAMLRGKRRDIHLVGSVAVLDGSPPADSRRCCWTTCAGAVGWTTDRFQHRQAGRDGTVATDDRGLSATGRIPGRRLPCRPVSAVRGRVPRRTRRARTSTTRPAYVAPGGSWRFPADAATVGDSGRPGADLRWREAVEHIQSQCFSDRCSCAADVLPAGHDVLPGAVRRARRSVRGQSADGDGDRRRQGDGAGDRRRRRGGGADGRGRAAR